MNYNPLVATVTIALGSLVALGAIVYQVVNGHEVDAQLAGLAGLLFGAFLRAPGQSDAAQAAPGTRRRVTADVAD